MSLKEMRTLTIGNVQYKITDENVGMLSNLNTTQKTSIVSAINELAANMNGSIDSEQVNSLIEDYLAKNPPVTEESDPTVPAWAKEPNKPTYTKSEVGLGNVDNTSDTNKPVSTAQATAIADAKKAGTDAQSNLTTHTNNKSNPHGVTKAQVGLGNVDDVRQYSTSNPPIVAQATAPTDTSVIWVDTDDNTVDEYPVPVRGIDYWTDDDRRAIIAEVVDSIKVEHPEAHVIYGDVDENNNIIIYGELASGTYTLKYENADGSVIEIGTFEQGATIGYINRADPINADWLSGQRLSSTGEVKTSTENTFVTNYIGVELGDVVRVRGMDIYHYGAGSDTASTHFYNKDKTRIAATQPSNAKDAYPKDSDGKGHTFTILDDASHNLTMVSGYSASEISYIRFSGKLYEGFTEKDIIITVNQEIV